MSGDPTPVGVQNPGAASPFLLVCDHAGRAVPRALGRLGLAEGEFDRHIAWDIGALNLASRLADRLGTCLIHQAYSRLVVDCNRAPGHPQSIVEMADGALVIGNQGLAPDEVSLRVRSIHTPYHLRIAAELDARAAAGLETLLICIHSFTPVMAGFARPWHVGVLHGPASSASQALLTLLRCEPGLVVGDNQPYAMDGADYTAPLHAWNRGKDVLEIEVRQDLIEDDAGAIGMAELFARLIPAAYAMAAAP